MTGGRMNAAGLAGSAASVQTDTMSTTDPLWGLPDPDTQAEFYADTVTKRFIAWVIDTAVIFLITALLVLFTAFLGLLVLPVLLIGVSFVYRTLTLSRASATPGMWLMSIELRNHRGERLDGVTSAIHVGLHLFFMSMLILQLVSVALMLMTPRRQGLHDMILGTAAVNRTALD